MIRPRRNHHVESTIQVVSRPAILQALEVTLYASLLIGVRHTENILSMIYCFSSNLSTNPAVKVMYCYRRPAGSWKDLHCHETGALFALDRNQY